MAINIRNRFKDIRIPGGINVIVPRPTLEFREAYIRDRLSSGVDLTGFGHRHDDEEMTKATDELLARLRKEYGFTT